MGYLEINLTLLHESAANPRKHFAQDALDDLASSIQQHGVITPLLVRPTAAGAYEVAAGHRRLRASRLAGLEHVPCIVRLMTDLELLEVIVVENNQREDIHPLEEGQGYQALVKAGYTVERIAERVGRSRPYVYERIALLKLTREAQELFLEGAFPFSHARILSGLAPHDQARAVTRPTDRHPDSGVFQLDPSLFDKSDVPIDKLPVKACSVRELQDWITENVRLDPASPEVALFPDTAAALEVADRVVSISKDWAVPAGAAPKGAIYAVRDWRRADGEKERDFATGEMQKSKECESSILGVVVIGEGKGECFRVCVEKECDVHFGKKQREQEKRALSSKASREQAEALQKKFKREEAERARLQTAWKAAESTVFDTLAAAIQAAEMSKVAKIVVDHCLGFLEKKERARVTGVGADEMRTAALALLTNDLNDWGGPAELAAAAKTLGVDVNAIVKSFMPAEPKAEKAAPKKKVRS